MIQKSVSMLPKTVMARIKHASQTAIHEASGGLPNKNYFHQPSRPRNKGHQTTAKPKSTKLQPTVSAAPLLDRKKHEFWAWIGPHFGAHWATPKWDLLVPDNKAAPKQGTKCGPSAGTIHLPKLQPHFETQSKTCSHYGLQFGLLGKSIFLGPLFWHQPHTQKTQQTQGSLTNRNKPKRPQRSLTTSAPPQGSNQAQHPEPAPQTSSKPKKIEASQTNSTKPNRPASPTQANPAGQPN